MKFAGIGSRKTPGASAERDILAQMESIAYFLGVRGHLLRSGAAEGADTAFEDGCDRAGGLKEIFLPWQNFNNHPSRLFNVTDKAIEMAKEIHEDWSKLTEGGQKLHGRNIQQILGERLDDPVDFVVYWTKAVVPSGGTRTAVVCAEKHGIKKYNLLVAEDRRKLAEFLQKLI